MEDRTKQKQAKIASFDPDGPGQVNAGIFGLPFTPFEADVVIIPVPWDVTVSNWEGTSKGPANILEQSPQIDLYDETITDPWKAGIAMEQIDPTLEKLNKRLRNEAVKYIQAKEQSSVNDNHELNRSLEEINNACKELCEMVRKKSEKYLEEGKLAVVLGGDHSTPLGLIQALNRKHEEFGILQIDAHADLRPAYLDFEYSHASVMYNASRLNGVKRIVQLGLRDICSQEALLIKDDPEKFHPFYAREVRRREFEGETWQSVCSDIIDRLPDHVYISFDIDGLDPSQCSSTGTPVPGGLSYDAVLYLFDQLVKRGKTIIGFDLVETGSDPVDGIVACRILYKTIAMMLRSNGKA